MNRPDEERSPADEPHPAGEPPASASATPAADPRSGADVLEAAEQGESPYRNLWVPLVVVPAVVVGVIVLVFSLFGQIAGHEAGLEENLERMISGGKNEREQAAFNLVRQVLENRQDVAAGREPELAAGPDFPQRLREAWTSLEDQEEPELQLAVATLMAEFQDPAAVPHLSSMLRLDPREDPEGKVRLLALQTAQKLPALAPDVIALLDDRDHGLRLAAAATLQVMPGPATIAALKDLLQDSTLDLRAMAAVSLSHLGDASGAGLLRDLTGAEIYAAVHAENKAQYGQGELVRSNRIRAIQALDRLGRPEDRELLASLSTSDPDIEVREAALQALAN